MSVTVRGTDILFNDGTTQSTAGQPTSTSLVLSATAGATAGAVGAYAFAGSLLDVAVVNSTLSGSRMFYAHARSTGYSYTVVPNSPTLSGTWRCMSGPPNTDYVISVWLRIA